VRVSGQVMKLLFVAGALLAGVLGLLPLPAGAVGPEPAPLAPPVQLTVGYQKVGHLAPVILVADELKKLGVDLKLVEFVRYADARTALLAGSLDAASVGPADLEAGPIGTAISMNPPPGTARWGAGYRDFLAKYFARYAALVAQTENLAYADQTIDLDPDVRDQYGLPAPRLTYDWRRPNELARVEFLMKKMEEIAHAMGATQVWRAPVGPGAPGAHHEGGTRMGNDPKTSVVNRYGQTWDIPNLFVIGSSTFPSMSGFNPTLTIQAVTYMSADAIVNRYKNNPGPLV